MKRLIDRIPEGAAALFFIQMFSTLGFAVLYSTLVLYTTGPLGFPVRQATAIMGVFGAFNYGLHLFGGYLGGRFLSNRNLFVAGMALQVAGSATIGLGTTDALYWGLALFLTGSGLQRHLPEHDADPALRARGQSARGGVPVELRRHERRLLHRLHRPPATTS